MAFPIDHLGKSAENLEATWVQLNHRNQFLLAVLKADVPYDWKLISTCASARSACNASR